MGNKQIKKRSEFETRRQNIIISYDVLNRTDKKAELKKKKKIKRCYHPHPKWPGGGGCGTLES